MNRGRKNKTQKNNHYYDDTSACFITDTILWLYKIQI